MSKMPLVYLAGPYRAPTEHGVAKNILAAWIASEEVWKAGCACICPHANAAFMAGEIADEVFLEGDLVMLERCDAVLMMDGWELSEGSIGEYNRAKELGIPVFESMGSLRGWVWRREREVSSTPEVNT